MAAKKTADDAPKPGIRKPLANKGLEKQMAAEAAVTRAPKKKS